MVPYNTKACLLKMRVSPESPENKGYRKTEVIKYIPGGKMMPIGYCIRGGGILTDLHCFLFDNEISCVLCLR